MQILKYTLLRLAVFAAVFAVLYFVGMKGALLWIGAILIAFLLSFIFFPDQGDAAAAEVQRIAERRRTTRPATEGADETAEDDRVVGEEPATGDGDEPATGDVDELENEPEPADD